MAAYKDVSIFITGCNRGIGLAFVKQFVKLPFPPRIIIATCRSLKSDGSKELRELAKKHPILQLLEFDVTNSLQLESVVENVQQKLGDSGLNLLINNAGIYDLKNSEYGTRSCTLDEVDRDLMLKVFETNTVAPLMITKAFVPLLRQAASHSHPPCQPQAMVVNISSTDGSLAYGGGGHYQYRCSKAAINMVTKCLSADLTKYGITVVSMDPGWIKTDMGGKAAPLTLSDAIPVLVKSIGSLDQSKNGTFLAHDGHKLPW